VIICSIENFDAMGVHTGDSITVAPAQTLTDKEYQILRDASLKIIREIGVDTGGSNIQFGINPVDGRLVVIEMNPRVSRSSALASKATGFPIAKIAAKLSVGYRLDEISNDITRETLASFEPTIDYVVTKIPRFTFEKFPQADATLTTQMKSVGEAMAIGRTFKESFHKALRSMEIGSYGLESRIFATPLDYKKPLTDDQQALINQKLQIPGWERIWYLADALRAGFSVDKIHQLSGIDPWFVSNLAQLIQMEGELLTSQLSTNQENPAFSDLLRQAKQFGFSDRSLATLVNSSETIVRQFRHDQGIRPVYKRVDTCGAEFEAYTPYFYSTYETECEAEPTDKRKIIILGGGPNRIGQGIEFDYCCVHGAFALSAAGFETIMVNCNPETVSTDYDTSDRLYFEPLTLEDVLEIVAIEKPEGVIVQYGGQTPLKLAVALERAGVPVIGTSPDAIDRAEDRERFQALLNKLGLLQPDNGIARSCEEAEVIAERIGYPVVVRPSYVLGGRAMEIVYDVERLRNYMKFAVEASPEHPILVDKFLQDAIEVDVDAVADGVDVVIGGIMQHIEEAGIHSGDSACALPTISLSNQLLDEIRRQTRALALELKVVGLMNIQYAIKSNTIYLLEVNPRASRTVPFVSKATGRPLAQIAALVMAGQSLAEQGIAGEIIPPYISVKEAVFPFVKFPGVDTLLGPEMKSTGEVMGIDFDFGRAFAKAQIAAGVKLPTAGAVFISVKDTDKQPALAAIMRLANAGFKIVATAGTGQFCRDHGVEVTIINKVKEGRPHCVDAIKNREFAMVFNTTLGAASVADSYSIRRAALMNEIAYFTTVAGINAVTDGVLAMQRETLDVKPLQEYYQHL
ncbi:MAG TPA: carbamoyl-phosphate synthase large subunit, partial [Pelovirga sp.]|nr:carbamoyl-phosphate synthase large subunit [Pelovirga sp.]